MKARSKFTHVHMASVQSVQRASSFLQPLRITAAFQAFGHWRVWRRSHLQILARFSSDANSSGTTENPAIAAVNKPYNEVLGDKTEEILQTDSIQDQEGSVKNYGSWKRGSKGKPEEDVILKVLPGLGEPKALKFRLGKKHVTMDRVREKNLMSEDFLESEDDFELSRSVGELPKNIEGRESEATSRLLQSLSKKLSLSDKDQSLYSKALPSIFGTTVGGAKEVAMTIKRAGFKKKEVSSVLPRFPNILDVNYDNVARVYKILQKEYKMNKKWLQGLLRRHPFVFTLNEQVVRDRMDALVELGLRSREISKSSSTSSA